MSEADRIRRIALKEFISPARMRGDKTVTVAVDDIHKAAGLKGRYPNVCNALKKKIFLKENQLALVGTHAPPSGASSTVRYTYAFCDVPGRKIESVFDKLRRLEGIAKGAYGPEGGEAYLRREREEFGEGRERL